MTRFGSAPAIAITSTLALAAGLWLGRSPVAIAADPPAKGPDQLLVLATGSNRGEVEQCGCKTNPKGGLARRAALIDSLRQRGTPLLTVDAGGMLHNDAAQGARYDPFIISAMNRMGYDAVTLGRNELIRGDAQVRALVKQIQAKVVVTNVKPKAGVAPWMESAILTIGGHKVAIVGLVGQEFDDRSSAIDKSGFTVEAPLAAVARVVPALAKEADWVVALAHLDTEDLDRLVAEGKGIDLVVAGYNSFAMATQPEKAVATLLRPGQRGEYVGFAHFGAKDAAGGRTPITVESVVLDVKRFREDPALASELATLKAQAKGD